MNVKFICYSNEKESLKDYLIGSTRDGHEHRAERHCSKLFATFHRTILIVKRLKDGLDEEHILG